MKCTRQAMHHVAIQRSDEKRASFMAEVSLYDPSMLVWLDESGCDRRNTVRKYGYSMRGIPLFDQHLLVRGIRYSAIPIISMDGVYLAQGSVNRTNSPNLWRNASYGSNHHSVVVMDNAAFTTLMKSTT